MMNVQDIRPEATEDLTGAVAVVTGGSRGIGAATAHALARSGAAVAVVGRDGPRLDQQVLAIRESGGRAIGVVADCTSESDLAALMDRVHAELGPVNVLCAFAGGNGMPRGILEETLSRWRHVLENDLTLTFLTISAFLPDMIGLHHGSIVTMSSSAARGIRGSSAAYASAKAGVIGLSQHLALELASHNIRVNSIAPATMENGRIETHMTGKDFDALSASFSLGRIGGADDAAEAAVFLCSSRSSWITGIVLDVAGGKVIR